MNETKGLEIPLTEEKESKGISESSLTIQIAGAAIFGALSIVISFIAAFLPRYMGFAYFDPVSIIWMVCFLIFGPIAGILCSIIGMVGLMFFDPFAPIGPLMKLAATLPMIIVPTLLLKLYKRKKNGSEKLKDVKNFTKTGIAAIIVRLIVMIPINIIVYLLLYSAEGLMFWIIFAIIFNVLQGIWDLLIPYLLVYTTKLDEKFDIW
ncbi:MAG: ECF transporter S component [Candidatus Lokiarchaeota archaeon]|nr:ECF transporter S component [Candidatus Lokiarchaeota archaeon]